MTTQSQNKQILAYLRKGRSITAIGALKLFGCFRLASRCYDLRKQLQGTNESIKTDIVSRGGKNFASYKLVKK